MRLSTTTFTLVSAVLAHTAHAQDLIGVEWSGNLVAIDGYTGIATTIGTGAVGQNSVAVAGGAIWTQQRTGLSPYSYDLSIVDPVAGTATPLFNNSIDLRGMAGDGNSTLIWATHDTGSADDLVLLDTTTGNITTIGPTGFTSIQALEWHNGVLYALDNGAGLLVVDPGTGTATDVNPSVGVPSTGNQFLASRGDGTLICGRSSIFEIDTVTGQTTLIGSSGASDIRGAATYFGHGAPFGQGCAGGSGTLSHVVTGTLTAGGTLNSVSSNHSASAAGAMLLGFAPLAAPISLDPFFGTTGCSLLVSTQLTAPLVNVGTDLSISLNLGLDNGGFRFDLQHISLEPVPGGLGVSNATHVFIGY